jgi:GNAT superfamily N-acetyltransferase
MTTTQGLMILIAGPYRSGTGDDPAKMAANVHAMEAYALPLFRAGHLPVLGEWMEVIPESEPYVEIEDIYVQPDFRNQDIGGQLLEQVFAVAQAAGIQRFVLGTKSKETDKILRFYPSHGFTPWSIQFFR